MKDMSKEFLVILKIALICLLLCLIKPLST